jgi:hypothetical protein
VLRRAEHSDQPLERVSLVSACSVMSGRVADCWGDACKALADGCLNSIQDFSPALARVDPEPSRDLASSALLRMAALQQRGQPRDVGKRNTSEASEGGEAARWPVATPRAVSSPSSTALVLNPRKRGHHRGEAAPNTRAVEPMGSVGDDGVLT